MSDLNKVISTVKSGKIKLKVVIDEEETDKNDKNDKKLNQYTEKKNVSIILSQIKNCLKIKRIKGTSFLEKEYVSSCETIYKLIVKLDELQYNITKKLYNDIDIYIKDDILGTNMELCYYLYTDLSKLSFNSQLRIQFDNIFYKMAYAKTLKPRKSLFLNINTSRNPEKKSRIAYINYIMYDIDYLYYFMVDIIQYKTKCITFYNIDDARLLINMINNPQYDINIEKLLENSFYECGISLLESIIVGKQCSDYIYEQIENFLKSEYAENNNNLLNTVSQCHVVTTNTAVFRLIDMCIKYTDCNGMIKYYQGLYNNYFVGKLNIMKFDQKINIIDEMVYKTIYINHCYTDDIEHMQKVFNDIFSVVEPNTEYLNVILNCSHLGVRQEGFNFLLGKNVIPNDKSLEYACKYMEIESIYKIMEYKTLPNEQCMENCVSYQCNDVDNIKNVNNICELLISNGIKLTMEHITKALKRHIQLDIDKLGIKYSIELYNLYNKYLHRNLLNIDKFSALPEYGMIKFREALYNCSTWNKISQIGLEYKIIPTQECLNTVCEYHKSKLPEKFIKHLRLYNSNDVIGDYSKHIEEEKDAVETDYELFFKDKINEKCVLTSHISDLLSSSENTKCLHMIAYAFMKHHENLNAKQV